VLFRVALGALSTLFAECVLSFSDGQYRKTIWQTGGDRAEACRCQGSWFLVVFVAEHHLFQFGRFFRQCRGQLHEFVGFEAQLRSSARIRSTLDCLSATTIHHPTGGSRKRLERVSKIGFERARLQPRRPTGKAAFLKHALANFTLQHYHIIAPGWRQLPSSSGAGVCALRF
jgi:hypothetical protein